MSAPGIQLVPAIFSYFGWFWFKDAGGKNTNLNIFKLLLFITELIQGCQIVYSCFKASSSNMSGFSQAMIFINEHFAFFALIYQSVKFNSITANPQIMSVFTNLDSVMTIKSKKKVLLLMKLLFCAEIILATLLMVALTAYGRYQPATNHTIPLLWTMIKFFSSATLIYQLYHFQTCVILTFYVIVLAFTDIKLLMRRHFTLKTPTVGIVSNVAQRHQDVYATVDYANNMFSPGILAVLTSGVTTLSSIVYRIWANDTPAVDQSRNYALFYLFVRLSPIFIICEIGEILSKQFQSTSAVLYTIENCTNENDRLQLLLLESKLKNRKAVISASGFIDINRKLVYNIIVFIFTYSTMMIQFAIKKRKSP